MWWRSRFLFWMPSEMSVGERAPLLGKAEDSQELHTGNEVDVIDRLESLPMLLMRAVAVFTMALVASTSIGAVRSALGEPIPTVVCMIPTMLAQVWLVHELLVSVKFVRRAMIGEERKRRQSLRRIARRRRAERRQVQVTQSSRPTMRTGYGLLGHEGIRDRTRVTMTRAVTATVTAATASAAEITGTIPIPQLSLDISDSPSDTLRQGAETIEQEIKTDNPSSSLSEEPDDIFEDVVNVLDVAEAAELGESTALAPTAIISSPKKSMSWPPSQHEYLQSNQCEDRDGMSAISARVVRISFLLQAWVRLWLMMSAFAIIVSSFSILLFLRLMGIAVTHLSAGAIASPVIAALTLLAIHSIIILDGDGGAAGGAALRGGGTRSILALGRRPIIILALLNTIILSMKLDAEELWATGSSTSAYVLCIMKSSWVVALGPLWIALALVEGVFLRMLWENRTGQSCITSCWGSFYNAIQCLGCGGCETYGRDRRSRRCSRPTSEIHARRHSSREDRTVSYYSLRRRAVLTSCQRAAASAIAGGLIFLTLAMLGCAIRNKKDPTGSWAIPLTMCLASVGEGLVGAGLWRLARENAQGMRGGLPPAAKPLPVLYSEREGGWIVGPADPPTISVFLLGEVTLRQEGACSSVGRLTGGADSGDNQRRAPGF